MKNVTKGWWIFIVNSLPLFLLFLILGRDYYVIKTLLSEESIKLWRLFSIGLFSYFSLNLIYGIYLTIKGRSQSLWFSISALVVAITMIYLYLNNIDTIIPFSIPQWMMPGDRYVYVGTFLMPTVAYQIFVLVVKLTDVKKGVNIAISFAITIFIPLVLYIFFTVLIPLWHGINLPYEEHVFAVIFISLTVAFIFFLLRAVYTLIYSRGKKWNRAELLWKIPLTIILPFLGLNINNSFNLFKLDFSSSYGAFGDFNSIWFYILTIANGIILCLPNLDRKIYRFILYIFRIMLFIFSIYFMVVFLPYLPFSVVAIIVFGAGILMLCPIVMFLVHLDTIRKDIKYLKAFISKRAIYISFIGILVIPLVLVSNNYRHKVILNRALNYVYNPDYSSKYSIDRNALEYTINSLKKSKRTRRNIFENADYIPYLSSIYTSIVLDNLTLSRKKINYIGQIFFDETSLGELNSTDNDLVVIKSVDVESSFDESRSVWISNIHLELKNNSSDQFLEEYSTTFDLPVGAWISNYYLDVFGVREPGILSEKKSAMWIYNQIRNVDRRDPGILHYLTGNKVKFSVYPFLKDEVRKTGIEILHREKTTIDIDGHNITLGDDRPGNMSYKDGNIIYISKEEKSGLDLVQREPYYHFLVDISLGKGHLREKNIRKINNFINSKLIGSSDSKVSFVNSYVTTYDSLENLEELYPSSGYKGGFFLDRAIKSSLVNSYEEKHNSYPVFVVVTDSYENSIIEEDFTDFKITYPDWSYFYVLDDKGALKSYSLDSPRTEVEIKEDRNRSVLVYPDRLNPIAYIENSSSGSLVIKSWEAYDIELKKDFGSALELERRWIRHKLFPSGNSNDWRELAKGSFKSKIMTPVTSYLVVENEAQKQALYRKQKEALSGRESLDLMDEPQEMSEPGLIILLISILTLYLIKNRLFLLSRLKVNSVVKSDKINDTF